MSVSRETMAKSVSRETLIEQSGIYVPRETFALLSGFVDLLIRENRQQNLIAKSSVANIWVRHIADSMQLVPCAPRAMSWLDVGSGPGLPGIVISIASMVPTVLVEPRRLRTAFLEQVVATLGLRNVNVVTSSLAHVPPRPFDAITARAVAPLDRLLDMTLPFSHPDSVLVFPKGRSAAEELAAVRRTWHGHFEIIPSRTDADAGIVVARDVRRRGK